MKKINQQNKSHSTNCTIIILFWNLIVINCYLFSISSLKCNIPLSKNDYASCGLHMLHRLFLWYWNTHTTKLRGYLVQSAVGITEKASKQKGQEGIQADKPRRHPSRCAKKASKQIGQEGSQADRPRRHPSRWAKKAIKQMDLEGIQADKPRRHPSRWDKKASKQMGQEGSQEYEPRRHPSRCAKKASKQMGQEEPNLKIWAYCHGSSNRQNLFCSMCILSCRCAKKSVKQVSHECSQADKPRNHSSRWGIHGAKKTATETAKKAAKQVRHSWGKEDIHRDSSKEGSQAGESRGHPSRQF